MPDRRVRGIEDLRVSDWARGLQGVQLGGLVSARVMVSSSCETKVQGPSNLRGRALSYKLYLHP